MGINRALAQIPSHEPVEHVRIGLQLPKSPFVKLAGTLHPLLGHELRRRMPHQPIAAGQLFRFTDQCQSPQRL